MGHKVIRPASFLSRLHTLQQLKGSDAEAHELRKLHFEKLSWCLVIRIPELRPLTDRAVLLRNIIAGFITPVLGLFLFVTTNAT